MSIVRTNKFYREDEKTKPITPKKSDWNGQTEEAYWSGSEAELVKRGSWDHTIVAEQRFGDSLTENEIKKKKQITTSEAFKIWWTERRKHPPVPSDPYRAFMIDRGIQAHLTDPQDWKTRMNRSDYEPIDFPPIVRGKRRIRLPKAPSNKEAERTKRKIRDRARFICKDMGVDKPEVSFCEGSQYSYYQSGYAINKLTGEVVRLRKPKVVIGISKSGKLYPMNYGALAHELGHHKDVVMRERSGDPNAIQKYYLNITSNKEARNESERTAWKYADPYMVEKRAVQKWHKKYALGTYLGTTPR